MVSGTVSAHYTTYVIPSFPIAVKDEIKEEIETDQDFPMIESPISTEDLKCKKEAQIGSPQSMTRIKT